MKDIIEIDSFSLMVCSVSKSKKELAFEEALENLEAIIEQLESGNVPLADLVVKYEEGTQLLKTCHDRLNEAELKIEKLREQSDQPVIENFDPDA